MIRLRFKSFTYPNVILSMLVIAVVAILPTFIGKSWISLITEIFILAIACSALNLLVGYSGQVSFGHAGFYCFGGYTLALLLTKTNCPFFLAISASILFSAMAAGIIGWFSIRLVSHYFALLTFAFAQIIYFIVFQWYSFTGGDNGITDIPIPKYLIASNNYYFLTFIIFLISLLLMKLYTGSPFGKAIQATRENPMRAGFIGINVKRYQLINFIISGTFTGLAGALYVGLSRAAFPSYGDLWKSGSFLVICLLGGIGNFYGPAVGSLIYTVLEKIITESTEYWPFFLGLILVLLCLFMREGIIVFIEQKYKIYKNVSRVGD
jgi:branched-chain amino acid transport system permease protein